MAPRRGAAHSRDRGDRADAAGERVGQGLARQLGCTWKTGGRSNQCSKLRRATDPLRRKPRRRANGPGDGMTTLRVAPCCQEVARRKKPAEGFMAHS